MPPLPGTAVPPGPQSGLQGAIQRVAIIGAGAGGPLSGANFALLCLRAGFTTILEDVLPSNLRRAADALQAAGQGTSMDQPPLLYAGSIEEAVREADLVIDTVPDELESKLEILSLLDRMAPPATLFATPTETLSIADLASCTYRPGQCFGLRFPALPIQSLPPQVPRVVLSYAPACQPATLARMESFLLALGAAVVLAEDTRPLP